MYIAENLTTVKKPLASLNNNVAGDLVLPHPEALLKSSEENQAFSPDATQLARYLDACCDCV